MPERGYFVKNSPQEVVIKIDLSAIAGRQKVHRTPLNLAVVLDRSGSMTGAKLEKTKQAAMQLVDRLAPNDIFSLVIFSDEARVLVPAQRVEDKDALKEKIESIQADGSTALYAGVKMGADQLQEFFSSKRINRVILLSDGLANVGPSSPRDLRRLGSDLAERGISVTTIGVGDDYNEDLMAGLAEASDANYYYVKDTEKLPEIFAKELGELLTVAARDVRIEIVCPDGVKPLGFIGRAEKFDSQRATVNLSQFTGGQNRYLFLRCLVNGDQPEVAKVNVSYTDELGDGSVQTATGTARIDFTDDQKPFRQIREWRRGRAKGIDAHRRRQGRSDGAGGCGELCRSRKNPDCAKSGAGGRLPRRAGRNPVPTPRGNQQSLFLQRPNRWWRWRFRRRRI